MTPPPVLNAANWDELIAALAAPGAPQPLAGLENSLARAVLAAPAAIAFWIAQRAPGLRERDPLRVLVAGAETVDAVDEGRWYGMLAPLLASGSRVDAVLVGSELDYSFASAAAASAPRRAARGVRGNLAAFLDANGVAGLDVVFLFHPGLVKHRGWLTDGSIGRIIGAGIPVVAAAYEEDEFEMERCVAECHGYRVAGEPLLNPYFLDLDHDRTQARWGRALWQFAPTVPALGAAVDVAQLAELENLTRMTMHSVITVGRPGPDPGAQVQLRAQTGAHRNLIHVFDHRFVEPVTSQLLRLDREGGLEVLGTLPPDQLASWPGPGSRPLARAMWAARVKADHLLGTYPAPPNPVAVEDKQKTMLATLRSRAARLFAR